MLYIMAAGKSSRFGSPKIIETYKHNIDTFKEFFKDEEIFIVTNKKAYDIIKLEISEDDANFIIGDYGNGSGTDVYDVFKEYGEGYFCWSDVFYSKAVMRDIMEYEGENTITGTFRKEPYVSLIFPDNILTKFQKNDLLGYQDNSIFYVKELSEPSEEFLDMCILNKFTVQETNNKSLYFNTKEELKSLGF